MLIITGKDSCCCVDWKCKMKSYQCLKKKKIKYSFYETDIFFPDSGTVAFSYYLLLHLCSLDGLTEKMKIFFCYGALHLKLDWANVWCMKMWIWCEICWFQSAGSIVNLLYNKGSNYLTFCLSLFYKCAPHIDLQYWNNQEFFHCTVLAQLSLTHFWY